MFMGLCSPLMPQTEPRPVTCTAPSQPWSHFLYLGSCLFCAFHINGITLHLWFLYLTVFVKVSLAHGPAVHGCFHSTRVDTSSHNRHHAARACRFYCLALSKRCKAGQGSGASHLIDSQRTGSRCLALPREALLCTQTCHASSLPG